LFKILNEEIFEKNVTANLPGSLVYMDASGIETYSFIIQLVGVHILALRIAKPSTKTFKNVSFVVACSCLALANMDD
jgi:hypothetical protein